MKNFKEILTEKKEFPSEEQVRKDAKKVFGITEVDYFKTEAYIFVEDSSSYNEIGKLKKLGYKIGEISASNKVLSIYIN